MKQNKHAVQIILAVTAIVLLGIMAQPVEAYEYYTNPMGSPAAGTPYWDDPLSPSTTLYPRGPNHPSSNFMPVVPQPWTEVPGWSVPTPAVRSPVMGVSGGVFSGQPFFTGTAPRFSSLPGVPRPEQNCQEHWCAMWPYSVNSDPMGFPSPQYYPYMRQRPRTTASGEIWRS